MPVEGEALEAEVAKFEKAIRARNLREWLAAAFVSVVYGITAATASGSRWSPLVVVAAALFVIVYLYLFGRSRVGSLEGPDLRTRYQTELGRQARLLRSAPFWYAVPLGATMAYRAWVEGSVTTGAVAVLLGAGISYLNVQGASSLQRRADALA
jgi:hypothetical protein